jgi:hypothetical protein
MNVDKLIERKHTLADAIAKAESNSYSDAKSRKEMVMYLQEQYWAICSEIHEMEAL